MARHPSAIKRHRQSVARRVRNVESKSRLRTLMKKARQAIEDKKTDEISAHVRAVNKALSKAVNKGLIKSNTASRWLSRIARAAAH